jgi:hypothetical protein
MKIRSNNLPPSVIDSIITYTCNAPSIKNGIDENSLDGYLTYLKSGIDKPLSIEDSKININKITLLKEKDKIKYKNGTVQETINLNDNSLTLYCRGNTHKSILFSVNNFIYFISEYLNGKPNNIINAILSMIDNLRGSIVTPITVGPNPRGILKTGDNKPKGNIKFAEGGKTKKNKRKRTKRRKSKKRKTRRRRRH